MRIISKVAAIALVLFALIPAVAVGAEDCATDPYCTDSSDVDAGRADTGGGASVDASEPEASSGAPAAAEPDAPAGLTSAPSGGLPITGGDVIGMATVGAVAIALGAVLVRRSKVAKQNAA